MSSTEVGLAGQPLKPRIPSLPEELWLGCDLCSASVAVIGATQSSRRCRADRSGEPFARWLSRKNVRRQRQASGSAGAQSLCERSRHSWARGSRRDRHAGSVGPAARWRMRGCGAKSAVVLSAGFRERGAAGVALEQQIERAVAAQLHFHALDWPQLPGHYEPDDRVERNLRQTCATERDVAFLSQSGAAFDRVLDWSQREQVGFSAIVSTGSMLDVGWGDLIYYFGDDPYTKSILLYMESVGDARSFLSAAREVALTNPIIAIKAGRSEAASRAAASHTGALTGSDEVLEAAFRRSGVLRVHNIADLFHMAEVLGKQPRPKGPQLTIVTNAGGPGVIATDSLVANGGNWPSSLRKACGGSMSSCLPTGVITIPLTFSATRILRAMLALSKLPRKTPTAMGSWSSFPRRAWPIRRWIAERLKPYAKSGKPVLASWMGGNSVTAGEAI